MPWFLKLGAVGLSLIILSHAPARADEVKPAPVSFTAEKTSGLSAYAPRLLASAEQSTSLSLAQPATKPLDAMSSAPESAVLDVVLSARHYSPAALVRDCTLSAPIAPVEARREIALASR